MGVTQYSSSEDILQEIRNTYTGLEILLNEFEDTASNDGRSLPPVFGRRFRRARSVIDYRCTGDRLSCKKGRRSQRRYECERELVADDIDDEDAELVLSSRSHFATLLEKSNEVLLDDFIASKNAISCECEDVSSPPPRKTSFESAEDAYMSIARGARLAIRKRLPLGMLEALDREIISYFDQKSSDLSNDLLEMSGLSSFQRLLAHASSAYNFLLSKSVDDKRRGRLLRIERPPWMSGKSFLPTTPALPVYIRIRDEVHSSTDQHYKFLR